VVAEGHGVVVESVHQGDGGIGLVWFLASEIEGQWRALNGVARIEKENIGLLGADTADERGDLGQATVGRTIGEVIDGCEVAMEVGGAEQRDGDPLRRGQRTLRSGYLGKKNEGQKQRENGTGQNGPRTNHEEGS
jgi:hypothetical protein